MDVSLTISCLETPPTVLLSFSGKASTTKALTKLKMAVNIKLVQIDTAVFSFEPILLRLQDIRSLELEDEVLCWKKGNEIQEPPSPPTDIIEAIEADPSQDLQALISTPKTVNLDEAQSSSLLMGLKQRVGLIQGPPGTGKSFIGAILAKIFHDTSKRILVVTYTNHALDQFLEDLLKIGIPPESMVRLGGKSTPRTQPLGLSEQKTDYKLTRDSWSIISALKAESERLKTSLVSNFEEYKNSKIDRDQLLEYLEFLPEDPDIYEAFQLPEMDNDMTLVGRRGKAVTKYYLLDRWLGCMDAGLFESSISGGARRVWEMDPKARAAEYDRWEADLLREQAEEIYTIAEQYNDCQKRINLVFSEKDSHIMRSKRIVGCTTTAAAKYVKEIQAANSEVLLVEEAGEILESHILTALGPQTKQMVLIGDHKQLRPKVANYKLSVEKGAGYDLNRSLFERLVLKGYPHQTLSAQYRMRPEISDLIRHLTYPDLIDAPKTQRRANVRGLQDNLIFIEHNYAEDNNRQIKEKEESSVSSKQNTFEAQMVLKCVKYLGQQGYGTDKIVVLTPYLGQLHLLRAVLSKENDPVLNDLDYHDLVKAGYCILSNEVLSVADMYYL